MLTWTLYIDGELVDVITDKEVGDLMRVFKTVICDLVRLVVDVR